MRTAINTQVFEDCSIVLVFFFPPSLVEGWDKRWSSKGTRINGSKRLILLVTEVFLFHGIQSLGPLKASALVSESYPWAMNLVNIFFLNRNQSKILTS